jgi:hypothetical protein
LIDIFLLQVRKKMGKDSGKIYAMKVLRKASLVRDKNTKKLEREINIHAKVCLFFSVYRYT